MADFQITLRDTYNQLGITLSSNKEQLLFEDFSNYDESVPEAGHERADFSSYRVIRFTFPDSSTKSFGSITGVDEAFSAPSASIDTFTYDHGEVLKDGVYVAKLISVPEHDVTEIYEVDDDYVYDTTEAKLYRCIQTTTGVELITNTSYWLEVTEADLSSKYQTEETFAIVQSLTDCIEDAIDAAVNLLTSLVCSDKILCSNETFMKAVKLVLVERAVTIKSNNLEWTKVATLLDYANQLCCGC